MLRLFLVTNIRVYAFCKTKPLNLHIRSLLTVVRHEKNVVETHFVLKGQLKPPACALLAALFCWFETGTLPVELSHQKAHDV